MAEILKFFGLLWFLTSHQVGCWKPLLCLPEGGTTTQICGFSFVHRLVWFFFFSFPLRVLHYWSSLWMLHSAGHIQRADYRVKFSALGDGVCLWAEVEILKWDSSRGSFLFLTPFDVLIKEHLDTKSLLLDLLLSLRYGGCTSVLLVLLERNGFFQQCAAQLGYLDTQGSPRLSMEKSPPASSVPCCVTMRGQQWQNSSYLLKCIQIYTF